MYKRQANTILTCISAPMLFLLRPRPSLLSMKFTSILRFLISIINGLKIVHIDDTMSTVKSLVGFTYVTDICRPVMYTEFNTLIVEIKILSMEVKFMDSSDGLGRSKNSIGADIQVSIVLALSLIHI